jgi:hypothetical protein
MSQFAQTYAAGCVEAIGTIRDRIEYQEKQSPCNRPTANDRARLQS